MKHYIYAPVVPVQSYLDMEAANITYILNKFSKLKKFTLKQQDAINKKKS